jgi:hypothetical protein
MKTISMEIFFNWNVCSLKLKQCFQKLKAVQKTRKVLKMVEELMHGAGPEQRQGGSVLR